MDKDLATLILAVCHRSAKELADVAPLISEYCSEEDQEGLRLPLGRCIYHVWRTSPAMWRGAVPRRRLNSRRATKCIIGQSS
jgi:hypothetical protein